MLPFRRDIMRAAGIVRGHFDSPAAEDKLRRRFRRGTGYRYSDGMRNTVHGGIFEATSYCIRILAAV